MIFFLVFSILALHVEARVKSVVHCKGANAILEKHEDRVIGPIKIQPGAKLSFKVTIKVAEDIPADVELALLLKKKMGWFWPSIPCIKQLGSCTYPLACHILSEVGLPCQLKAGNTYTVDKVLIIPGDFSVPSFLINGEYRINAEVRNKSKVYGCVDIEAVLD